MTFTLTSPDLVAGGSIPARHTCDGEDISPGLSWADAPGGTRSFVLILDDPDARGFIHWVLFDLTGSASGAIPTGFASSPDAAPQGTNDFGRIGYGGPCPPVGTHRYRFTLHALDVATIGMTATPTAEQVRSAIEGHVIATATLEATYTRVR